MTNYCFPYVVIVVAVTLWDCCLPCIFGWLWCPIAFGPLCIRSESFYTEVCAGNAIYYPLWTMDCCHCFIVCLWMWKYPGFGLQLSCFGHVRAKNNSKLPCGLELYLTFCLGLSSVALLLHRAVKGLCCCGMQWLVFGLCWLGRLLKAW